MVLVWDYFSFIFNQIRAASIPDDLDMLQQLVVEGYVIGTPPQDYDDSYCIEYARSHDGYVITNDLFRDYVEKKANSEDKKAAKNWYIYELINVPSATSCPLVCSG